MSNDQDRPTSIPVLYAASKGYDTKSAMMVVCPYCGKFHYHTGLNGHRIPPCYINGSLKGAHRGYYVERDLEPHL
jgi:hypothetical protein